ncbi:MAG: formylglycine-generating enzyme family protein [Deltaproteobacteria bacterium]|nr:formylglycine-generating enzyme family protein [Deltaproteobacteria bacterium]
MNQLAEPFPPTWASDGGEEGVGLWVSLTVDNVCQGFRWIPPGRFLMGSPESEKGRDSDEIQHEVVLSSGYWLADTPVTQALWKALMGDNPSDFKGMERPVENVTCRDVQRFIERLNESKDDPGFRLPTEAEWEYACRAGTLTPFSFGAYITTEQVNYNGNYPYGTGAEGLYREETVDVKALPSNDWGLYQMHGNVWELCSDRVGEYSREKQIDPQGAQTGEARVIRGGSWITRAHRVRSAYHSSWKPDECGGITGFRLALGG